LEWVKDIAAASDHTYGSRRVARALQALGYRVGRQQARHLMREAGVRVRYRRRYRVTTNSNSRQPVFENRLQRDFAVAAPDHVYAGDITYVWTQEGWLYLAVVIDLYSRKVVGRSMGRRTVVCTRPFVSTFPASRWFQMVIPWRKDLTLTIVYL
jgi:putative transposase